MNIIDWILFLPLAGCVGYLLFYAVASKFYKAPIFPVTDKRLRFAVLFPAYKEDRVILSSVRSFLQQEYPRDLFDVIVISDHMQPQTNAALQELPIRLLIAGYADSSKAKALGLAIDSIQGERYDAIVVMDADNLTTPHFLEQVCRAFCSGVRCVQAHRTGKNLDTPISLLDAVSEEINNGFFRYGHNAIGLSAALSGSGMAFEAEWFCQHVQQLETAGEDKELELLLLKERIYTVYLPHLPVYDEKTQKKEAIGNQRKRWIASQYGILRSALPGLWQAIGRGSLDYCNKVLQWMLPPRLVQLAAVFGLTLLFTLIGWWEGTPAVAIKWWLLSTCQVVAMLLPVPKALWNKELGKAVLQIPLLTLTTIGNLFRLKGVYRKFIHTEHGE